MTLLATENTTGFVTEDFKGNTLSSEGKSVSVKAAELTRTPSHGETMRWFHQRGGVLLRRGLRQILSLMCCSLIV